MSPFTVNGGTLIGLGTGNYTAPTSGKQSTIVLGSSSVGSANTSFAVVDGSGNPVFVYTLPAGTGDVIILSSPKITAGTTYTVKTGVTVKDGTGTRFHNLYTTMPTISGGTSSLSDVSTSSSNMVYTDSNAGNGFGAGGFGGGPGGFGGRQAFGNGEMPEPPEGFGNFNGQMPEGMTPPEGFNGQRPDNMPEPPDGFNGGRGNGQKSDGNFKGGKKN